jgi:hypothetical protein
MAQPRKPQEPVRLWRTETVELKLPDGWRMWCALESCGQEFKASRSDARYCSSACKLRAARARAK